MAKQISSVSVRVAPNVKRKGVHAKTKMSSSKSCKNYVKPYKGQGR